MAAVEVAAGMAAGAVEAAASPVFQPAHPVEIVAAAVREVARAASAAEEAAA